MFILFLLIGLCFPEWNFIRAQEKFQPAKEDVRNTKHNLSINPPDLSLYPPINPPEGFERNVSTKDTTEICVFCHTPHGANSNAVSSVKAPIWNRFLSSANYELYDQVWSFSFEGDVNTGAPTGYSRLCLSCHDGTIALGSVVNKAGSGGLNTDPNNPSYTMTYRQGQSPESEGGIAGSIPIGSGKLTGDTRRLGTDLTNDHPVSFVYDDNLANIDEELVYPGQAPNNTRPGSEPVLKAVKRFPGENLNEANAVQCTSCHNPHTITYPKFLRASLLQGKPNDTDQIICLFCHDKPGWPGNTAELNTHARSTAIHNKYPTVENPYDYDGEHSVEEYACRNCHDPHTVQGAKRLHREGVDPLNSTLDSTEATCYLCHSPNSGGANLIAGTTPDPLFLSGDPAPDVYSQFKKDPNFPLENGGTGSAMNVGIGQGHKPVFTAKPREGVELQPDMAGLYGPPNNRVPPERAIDTPDTMHVECVDCHNPHQVTGPSFSAVPNRMKGMKGIDINGNVVGHGVQGNDREVYIYEVCFRCHGNSYSRLFINDHYPGTTQYRSTPSDLNPPPWDWLSEFGPPPSPSDKNLSFPGFSNKRLEFNPDSIPDSQGMIGKVQYNPSFHPVAVKGRNQSFALSPNNPNRALLGGLSSQRTIMCTDCHNTDDIGDIKGPVTTSRPFSGAPNSNNRNDIIQDSDVIDNQTGAIGPHGSKNIRILRGNYNTRSNSDCRGSITSDCRYRPDITIFNNFKPIPAEDKYQQFELCFRCHDRRVFIDGTSDNTNFYGRYKNRSNDEKFSYLDIAAPITVKLWTGNLHFMHIRYSDAKCHDCHNNVHSNLQAPNTIYGNHNGDCVGYSGDNPPQPDNECYQDISDPNFGLPPNNNPQDDGTDGNGDTQHTDLHLINFNPASVRGNQSSKPRWYWGKSKWEDNWISSNDPSQKYMNCDLRCHGRVMNECSYQYKIPASVSPTTTRFSNCDVMDPILLQ
ncbi:MAG: cytochrome c3 family protein [Nitrospirota bacterium]